VGHRKQENIWADDLIDLKVVLPGNVDKLALYAVVTVSATFDLFPVDSHFVFFCFFLIISLASLS
jgi:hypothetical protein